MEGKDMMQIDEIKNMAAKSPELPKGLTLSEQEAFYAIGFLLAQWRSGAVSAEYTKSAYADISRAYDRACSGDELITWCVNLHKRVEAATAAYRHNRSLEAADYLVAVIDGMERGEEQHDD